MLWPLLVGACVYHLGTPAPVNGMQVGQVLAPVVEPGVGDDLRASLAAAIRRHGLEGEDRVDVRVESTRFDPAAGQSGIIAAWNAEVTASFYRFGGHAGEVRLSRGTVIVAPSGDSHGLDSARRAAFTELAGLLAEEAVDFLAFLPEDAP